ncbi:Maf family protein [Thalassotalea euphylliae]|uniref:Maf family protein n=1 Tax=Thalassotalea euphylliae TaxID=1655234 RepID=UPI0036419DE8
MFILASQSPRRQSLLEELGYVFESQPADIDESVLVGESPADYVARLALAKASAVSEVRADNLAVLGSDTTVVYEESILGKPEDFDDFERMMNMLSGRTHQVLTSISVVQGPLHNTQVIATQVTFKQLSSKEIKNYWLSGEPQDKAGGYGIQGLAAQFVADIQGSYSGVVGLPVYETVQLLSEFGISNSING